MRSPMCGGGEGLCSLGVGPLVERIRGPTTHWGLELPHSKYSACAHDHISSLVLSPFPAGFLCRYNYRVKRTTAALVLQSEAAVVVASSLLLGVCVAVGALLPGRAETVLYRLVDWHPAWQWRWWRGDWDRLVAGVLLPGS